MQTDLLAVSWGQSIVAIFFVLICVLLIMVILLQKGRGGGLSGAFGGVGGHSAFGAKTGDVFTWVTVGLTFLFIVVAVVGNYVFVPPEPGLTPAAEITPAAAVPATPVQPSEPTATPVQPIEIGTPEPLEIETAESQPGG